MSNVEKYHFNDFTYDNYRNILQLAKSRYIFRNYTDFKPDEPYLLWRHDVDYSMHSALKLASMETEENILATYFLYLHSELYNLLEGEITEIVRKIISMGHHIGLHFDCAYYSIENEPELENYLALEKILLERIFQKEVPVFSFHNPTAFTLGFKKWQYAGMINTYADYFQKEAGYCSDSNGYWRHRRLGSVLKEAKDAQLQVLTHPEWWQEAVMSPKQRIRRAIDGRAAKSKRWYDRLLAEAGRENVDWEGSQE
jgi:hypothetical protein